MSPGSPTKRRAARHQSQSSFELVSPQERVPNFGAGSACHSQSYIDSHHSRDANFVQLIHFAMDNNTHKRTMEVPMGVHRSTSVLRILWAVLATVCRSELCPTASPASTQAISSVELQCQYDMTMGYSASRLGSRSMGQIPRRRQSPRQRSRRKAQNNASTKVKGKARSAEQPPQFGPPSLQSLAAMDLQEIPWETSFLT